VEVDDQGTADTDDDETTQVNLANKNGKGGGDVNLVDRVGSRVQYYLSGTDFTRFGAWHRQTSQNAKDAYDPQTMTDEGDGPNSFAYSSLPKTAYITPTGGGLDSRFPAGARMTYTGDTVAVQDGKFFEGLIDVEVLWNEATAGLGGMINMTMSDIENVADGSRLYVDVNPAQGQNDVDDDPIQQLVSISISGVIVTANEDGELMLALDADSTVSVMSVMSGSVNLIDTTLHGAGTADDEASVMGYFAGQGLSGPLAVLGTWSMNSVGDDAVIGSRTTKDPGDTGDTVNETYLSVTRGMIHGAFGAEAP
jgi:hypothetical protein